MLTDQVAHREKSLDRDAVDPQRWATTGRGQGDGMEVSTVSARSLPRALFLGRAPAPGVALDECARVAIWMSPSCPWTSPNDKRAANGAMSLACG